MYARAPAWFVLKNPAFLLGFAAMLASVGAKSAVDDQNFLWG